VNHQSVNREQNLRLLISAVDSLTNGQHANASEIQALEDLGTLREASRNPAGVIHQKHIESTRDRKRRIHHLHETSPVRAHTGQSLVPIDMFGQHAPAF
jgi:hypothetical protein